RIAQRLAQLPGVGMVSLGGGQRPAIRVQVNPAALAAHNLSLEDVRNAISAANVNQPKGSFDGPYRFTMLDANDQSGSVEQHPSLSVECRNDAPLRLGDVAAISDGDENGCFAAWADRLSAVLVNAQRQPSANVIQMADRVRDLLTRMTPTMPA